MPSQKRSALYTLSPNSPSGIKPLTNSLDLMDQQCSSLVVVILNLIFLKNYFTLCNIRLLKMFELCLTSDSQSVQSDGFSIRCLSMWLILVFSLICAIGLTGKSVSSLNLHTPQSILLIKCGRIQLAYLPQF